MYIHTHRNGSLHPQPSLQFINIPPPHTHPLIGRLEIVESVCQCACVCVCVCMYVLVFVGVCVCVCMHMCVSACMRVGMCLWVWCHGILQSIAPLWHYVWHSNLLSSCRAHADARTAANIDETVRHMRCTLCKKDVTLCLVGSLKL